MEEVLDEDKNDQRRNDEGESSSGGEKSKTEDGSCSSPRPKIPRRSPSSNEIGEISAEITPHESTETNEGNNSLTPQLENEEDVVQEVGNRPSNSVVEAGPSNSAITAVIFNIKGAYVNRNYRRRSGLRSASEDSDDSLSDMDSDDLSNEDTTGDQILRSAGESRPIVEENLGSVSPDRDDNDSSEHNNSSDDNTSDNMRHSSDSAGDGSNTDIGSSHASSDSETEDQWTDPEMATDGDNDEYKTPNALLKPKPKHNWFVTKELINREMGLTLRPGVQGKSDVIFEQRYYGSLHTAYRFELMYKLERHKGCVNAINFHPEGRLLASGSDDLNVVVWDWTTNTPLQILKTGHKQNVFQSKFLYLNSQSQLNIVTSARDGQVRLLQCPPSGAGRSGAGVVRRRLATHACSAHKLHVTPLEPHAVLSCGEDGAVIVCDVRQDKPAQFFKVKEKNSIVPLFSIHGHPLEPREFCVAGRNSHIRVYDRRKTTKPLNTYCPTYLTEMESAPKRRSYRLMNLYVTCAIYNHDGSEILGSYNDDDIYLFDTLADRQEKDVKKEGYTHRYSGHRNNATFKGVSFFGPRSEFIVSGSDCSYIYMWERKTEAIAQWMLGDEGGVVNCIESHPRCPIMASSGLDKDVKIWVPSNEKDPTYTGLKEVVSANAKSQFRSPIFDSFLPTLYRAFNQNSPDFADVNRGVVNGSIEFDGQVCTIA